MHNSSLILRFTIYYSTADKIKPHSTHAQKLGKLKPTSGTSESHIGQNEEPVTPFHNVRTKPKQNRALLSNDAVNPSTHP